MASSIAPLTAAGLNAPSAAAKPAASGNGVLNQTDFLKLLTAQVQYQNPLSPVDSSTFLGQLSQLSATTGMQQLNSSFSDLLLLQAGQSVRRLHALERRLARVTRAGIVAALVLAVAVPGFLFALYEKHQAVAASLRSRMRLR